MKFNLTKESKFKVNQERKLAHNRLYHDGYYWCNAWFVQNGTNGSKELEKEMTDISNYMTDIVLPNGILDIWEIVDELELESVGYDEYNVFCSTDLANYWIRLIARRGDYNMYINVYEKDQ